MKKRNVVLCVILACILCASLVLVGCGGGGGNGGSGSNGNNPGQGQQGGNQNAYSGMFLGWGLVGDDLSPTKPETGSQGDRYCVLDAQKFLKYVEAFPEDWGYAPGVEERIYTGQQLTLTSTSTINPTMLQCQGTITNAGSDVYRLSLVAIPEIIFTAQDGTLHDLLDVARILVYYSPDRGILAPAEARK